MNESGLRSDRTGGPWLGRFRAAAVAYGIYGSVYLGGAIAALSPDRKVAVWGVPWWSYYLLGALFLALFPVLLWRGNLWLGRLLALGTGGKTLALCWKQGRLIGSDEPSLFTWFFLAVAATTTLVLARASFRRRPPELS